nr:Glyoxalase/Bleomycin resistance protein/Dioxygenase superfamily [uncultured bacterium]AIA14486.1 Glyoxalase/Bleomycin resistance protein/Dioxygenase superfamily [uncultured bacterium]
MKIKRIDHIGVVVNNLPAAKEFFVDFGFTVQGEAQEKSELLDKVTGVTGSESRIVFLQAPNGQIALELTQMIHPVDAAELPKESQIYAHGIRHLAFAVEDIETVVASMKQKGYDVFVDVYNYQDVYKLCYFRGPEGIIVELAEEL